MGSVTSGPVVGGSEAKALVLQLFVHQEIRGRKLVRKAALWCLTSISDTSLVENLEMKMYFKDLVIIF